MAFLFLGSESHAISSLATQTKIVPFRFYRKSFSETDEEAGEIFDEFSGSIEQQKLSENGAEAEAGNTLLYELDMQYRVLIEKYEALLEARKRDMEAEDAVVESLTQSTTSIGDAADPEHSAEPASRTASTETVTTLKDVGCQTEILVLKKRNISNPAVGNAPITVAPSRSSYRLPATEPAISTRNLASTGGSALAVLSEADQETFNRHFEHSPPEYKKLFAEIFAVLKKKVAEMPICEVSNARQLQSVTTSPGKYGLIASSH